MVIAPFDVLCSSIIPLKHEFRNCTGLRHPFLPVSRPHGILHFLKDLTADTASGTAKHGKSLRRVELHYEFEVLRSVMSLGIKAAAFQKHKTDAALQCGAEPVFQAEFIQLLQEAVSPCFLQLSQTILKHCLYLLFCGQAQDTGQIQTPAVQAVPLGDLSAHRLCQTLLHLPQGDLPVLPAVGIGDIEYIAEFEVAGSLYQKGDALGAAIDPTPPVVPEADLCTGCGVRLLGMDEKLVPEAVFGIPGGCGQKVHVGITTGNDALGFFSGQCHDLLCLACHGSFLLSSFLLLPFGSGEAPAVYPSDGIAKSSGIPVDIGLRYGAVVDLVFQGLHLLLGDTGTVGPVAVMVDSVVVDGVTAQVALLVHIPGSVIRMPTATYYSLRYLGVVNQLLSSLDMAGDYVCILEYANIAIRAIPGCLDAHYWLIYAMNHIGMREMANSQLKAAHQVLTEEDYDELLDRLGITE